MRWLKLFILFVAIVAIHCEEEVGEASEVDKADEVKETETVEESGETEKVEEAEETAKSDEDAWMNDEILSLTEDDFQSYIDENTFVLVEFYAPWCPHCKTLAPEYIKVAEELEEAGSRIKVAKVDSTKNQKISEKYSVKGYPTLKFFRSGTPVDYMGTRQAAPIVEWLNKKIRPAAEEIVTVEDAETFITYDAITVVGFFKDRVSDEAQAFLKTADSVDDYSFGITSNTDVYAKYGAQEGSIILFKESGKEKAVYDGELKSDPIFNFVAVESSPNIIVFNRTSHIVFSVVKSHLILFVSKKAGHLESLIKPAEDVAKQFRGKVAFVAIDSDVEEYERILAYFKLKTDDVPTMRLIHTVGTEQGKYTPKNSELSPENIQSFVQNALDGKLKKDLLGEELPKDWDLEPVKTLVSQNFEEVVLNKDKNVYVLFYAQWSDESTKVAKIWDEIGEKYEDSETVVIAKINGVINELDSQFPRITTFPTIMLFPTGDGDWVMYNGKKSLEGFVKFIDSDGTEVEPDDVVEEKSDESTDEKTDEDTEEKTDENEKVEESSEEKETSETKDEL